MGAEKVIDFRESDPDCPKWNRKLRWLIGTYQEKQHAEVAKLSFHRAAMSLGSDDPKWYNSQLPYVRDAFETVYELTCPWVDHSARRVATRGTDWSQLTEDEGMALWAGAMGVDMNAPDFDFEAEQEKALEALKANFPTEAELEEQYQARQKAEEEAD